MLRQSGGFDLNFEYNSPGERSFLCLMDKTTSHQIGTQTYTILEAASVDFITIEQTWASLFNCRYTYIEGKGYTLSRTQPY